ncbi:hypothetical protein QQF64_009247, partial [Cirrhinus molitorella]
PGPIAGYVGCQSPAFRGAEWDRRGIAKGKVSPEPRSARLVEVLFSEEYHLLPSPGSASCTRCDVRAPPAEIQYQMEMMRSLRHVNIDHLHVGWYQSTFYGSFVSRALLDSQFSYQHAIEESVVLIYDPIKTAQGSLCLKAYRLTPKLMDICKEKDFTPEALKKACIGFEHMFEEVPIVIKNSHLINVLLLDLQEKSTVADKHELLNLSSSNHLEKSLQLLMDRVDDMSQDIVKYNTYCRNLTKQQQQKQQYLQRRQQENTQRQSRGEPPLPEEDISKMFKPPQAPPRMDTLLIAGQINNYCQNIKEFTSQNLGKLFMAEALQGHSS